MFLGKNHTHLKMFLDGNYTHLKMFDLKTVFLPDLQPPNFIGKRPIYQSEKVLMICTVSPNLQEIRKFAP